MQVESAGGGFSEGNDKKIVLFPLISKKAAVEPLAALFPQFQFELEQEQMIRPPKRARAFFYRIDFLWLIPLIAVPSYLFYPYGLLSFLLIVPVLLLGIWQHKTARFTIQGSQLTTIYRRISRITFFVEKRRIQVVEQKQSYFQKRKRLATAQVIVMSGLNGERAYVYHMDEVAIEQMMSWYER